MKSIYYRSPYQQTLVKEIKTPMARALQTLADPGSGALAKARAVYSLVRLVPKITELPEPTVENTRHPNSHILIGISDRFFSRLHLPGRQEILRAIIKIVIVIYETDFYRSFMDVWINELKESDWRPSGPLQPDPHYWNEKDN